MLQRLFAILLVLFLIACKTKPEGPKVLYSQVIPQINTVQLTKKSVTFNSFIIKNNITEWQPQITIFKQQLKRHHQMVETSKHTLDITFKKLDSLSKEAYIININKQHVQIKASSKQGCFYALQSVLQLIKKNKSYKGYYIPIITINDAPRFQWRGVMLDVSRHFFDVSEIKRLIDIMAIHKLNVFHWHLTDTDGWRIEIKKYPKLTNIGAIGDRSNPTGKKMFYTQDDIKSIVAYAKQRAISIIPEIDMPGHAQAAVKAYPQFSGGGSKNNPDFTFNPANKNTLAFLLDVLKEVKSLFPSKYIHIGGDEVHFGNENWWRLKDVKALMKKKKFTTLVEVEHEFIRTISNELQKMNTTLVGWDEIINASVKTDSSVIMWWRHDKPEVLNKAFKNKYSVVLCPRIPLYFDFVQNKNHRYGRKWDGAFCPIDAVYNYPKLEVIQNNTKHILGLQANIWTEVIHNSARLDFMTFPRLTAFSEAAWTKTERKNYTDFQRRLALFMPFYKEFQINFQMDKLHTSFEISGPK